LSCDIYGGNPSNVKSPDSPSEDHTALAAHAFEKGYVFNYSGTRIVGREDVDKKRKILEVIHIISCENSVNFKTDIGELSKRESSRTQFSTCSSRGDTLSSSLKPQFCNIKSNSWQIVLCINVAVVTSY
jgi:hypothetical protein